MIPYADADIAKVPEALRGKTGYVFKEWNTKEDGTGETYKPGDSIKKLLETADMAKQAISSVQQMWIWYFYSS